MFIITEGSPITRDIINQAIDYNEKKAPDYTRDQEYYEGIHDINSRNKIGRFKNNKIVVNHAKYIVDIKTSHLIGKPVTYRLVDSKQSYDLTKVTDYYKQQNISTLDHELAKDMSKKGLTYERIYLDGNNPRSTDIDPRNCVMVYDDSVQHNKVCAIIYQLDKTKTTKKSEKVFTQLQVLDNLFIADWKGIDGTISTSAVSLEPHHFTYIPVIKYINNKEEIGDIDLVRTLIDAYNIVTSDRVNDKEQLVEAILAIKGMDFTSDMADGLRDNRLIANLPADGSVEYLTKELNEDQLHILIKDIEDAIHKISFTPNMSDAEFVGNSSGVAISYKLLPFEMDTQNKESYFELALKERFEIYNEYLNRLNGTPLIPTYEVDVVFTRGLPQNDFETSQMINNLDGKLPDVMLVKQLSFVENPEEAVEQAKEERKENDLSEQSNFGSDSPSGAISQLENKGSRVMDDTQESLISKIGKIINGNK